MSCILAITLDADTPVPSDALLAMLAGHRQRATFFVPASVDMERARRLAGPTQLGHEIGALVDPMGDVAAVGVRAFRRLVHGTLADLERMIGLSVRCASVATGLDDGPPWAHRVLIEEGVVVSVSTTGEPGSVSYDVRAPDRRSLTELPALRWSTLAGRVRLAPHQLIGVLSADRIVRELRAAYSAGCPAVLRLRAQDVADPTSRAARTLDSVLGKLVFEPAGEWCGLAPQRMTHQPV